MPGAISEVAQPERNSQEVPPHLPRLIRAQKVLGTPLSWDQFYARLNHALKHGYDHERGGLFNRGADDQPATDTDKVWWFQAEMLAALTEALKNKANRNTKQP